MQPTGRAGSQLPAPCPQPAPTSLPMPSSAHHCRGFLHMSPSQLNTGGRRPLHPTWVRHRHIQAKGNWVGKCGFPSSRERSARERALGRDLLSPGEGIRGAGEMDTGGRTPWAHMLPAQPKNMLSSREVAKPRPTLVMQRPGVCRLVAPREATQAGEFLGP